MRTMLRGKITLLFMMLGMLLAVPAALYAAELVTSELDTVTPNAVTVEQGGTTNFTIGLTATGAIASTITSSNASTATVDTAYSLNNTGAVSGSTPSSAFKFYSSGTGCSGQNCDVTWANAPTPYSVGASVSAASTTPVGDYTLVLSDSANTTDLTNPSVPGGKLADATATNITVHVVAASAPDADADGVPDASDNCPGDPNADQADSDVDGIGDVCDPTPNGDNIAPAIAPDNGTVTVSEGQTATNTGTWSDANANDTVNLSASVGDVVKNADGTWSWSYATTDGPDNSQQVTITATDSNGASSSTAFLLTVNNVAPTATFNSPDVNEGSNIQLSLTDKFDPAGANDTLSYAFDCGDGSGYSTFGTSSSTSCPTTDNGSRTVKAKIKDEDGGVTEYTNTVTISNVAPTATKNFDSSVNEGSSFNLALNSPSDPSSADTSAGFKYAFDCGGGSGYSTFGTSSSTSCPTTDNGNRSVGAKIKDKDEGVTEYTGTVTVNNVAPTITNITASAQNVLAGKNVTFTGTATDPSSVDTTAGFFWQWAVDGGALGTFGTQGNSQFTHSFSDCGSHSVSAKAKDKDDGLSDLFTKSNVVNVYSAHYLAPLNEGMYNSVQAGRVVPVKISVGCSGNLTGLQPSIQMLKGEQDGGESTTGSDNVETLSVSSADTTGIMRAIDGGYIYNLQVPSTAKANDLFTIRVNPFGGSNASSNMYIVLKIRK
jgi:hypothetical protein